MNISTLVTIKSNKFNYLTDGVKYDVELNESNNYTSSFRANIVSDYRQGYKYADFDPFIVLRESDEKIIHVCHSQLSDFKLIEGGAGSEVAWSDVTGKPSTFPPSSHTHPISEINNLEIELEDKADKNQLPVEGTTDRFVAVAGADGSMKDSGWSSDDFVKPGDLADVATSGDYNDLDNVPETVTWSNISGKPTVVAEGASQAAARTAIGAGTSNLAIGTTSSTAKAGDYQPTWGQVTGKPVFGTAASADSTDFATASQGTLAENAIPSSEKGAQNGVATLDSDIKIPKSQLPVNFGISTHISSAQASEVMAITGMVDDGMILANVWGLNDLARSTPILSIEISGTTVNVTLDTSGTTAGDNLQFGYEVK